MDLPIGETQLIPVGDSPMNVWTAGDDGPTVLLVPEPIAVVSSPSSDLATRHGPERAPGTFPGRRQGAKDRAAHDRVAPRLNCFRDLPMSMTSWADRCWVRAAQHAAASPADRRPGCDGGHA